MSDTAYWGFTTSEPRSSSSSSSSSSASSSSGISSSSGVGGLGIVEDLPILPQKQIGRLRPLSDLPSKVN